MAETSGKEARKICDLAGSYIGVEWIVGFIDENIDVSIDINKIGTSKKLTDANGNIVGTMEPNKTRDDRWYYVLHIKNDEYEVDGEIKQCGECCIRILNGEFEDYTVTFTFTETKQGFMPRKIELSNQNDEISLKWCTWGGKGFDISNPYAKVSYIGTTYDMKCDYPDGSGFEGNVYQSSVCKKDIFIHQTNRIVVNRHASINEVLKKPKLQDKILGKPELYELESDEPMKIMKITGDACIKGVTVEKYVKNDSLGRMLLDQFECIYSKLGFNTSLRELIGEDLIKSSGLALFGNLSDSKKASGAQKKKTDDKKTGKK